MADPSVPRTVKIGLGVLWVLVLAYYVVVTTQALLGLVMATLLAAIGYVAWRGWRAVTGGEQHQEEQRGGPPGRRESNPEQNDPVEVLKREYAEGKLSDAEFEQELERLLEAEEGGVNGEAGTDRQPPADRERETAADERGGR